ncbi:MAG: hypothetical protein SynsKO_02070 [Synoicihabitans sp.]
MLLGPILAAMFAAEPSTPLFRADFESQPSGHPYLSKFWETEGLVLPESAYKFGEHPTPHTLVDDAHPRGESKNSLRVLYPEGAVGPREGGAQAVLRLPPRQEYYLSYWLRFEEGFSWGGRHHGGKLPGLGATKLSSGGGATDGTDGFTARLMWRRNGAAVLYLYHMDKPGKWGEDFGLRENVNDAVIAFIPGEWYQVIQYVRINSDNKRDGRVKIWINDKEVLALKEIRFVNNGDLVDTLYFSTFHGGNTPDWGPRHDSVIHFDDFKIGLTKASVK